MTTREQIKVALRKKLRDKHFKYQSCLKEVVEAITETLSDDSEDLMIVSVISRDNFARAIKHFYPKFWSKLNQYIDKHMFLFVLDEGMIKPSPIVGFLLQQYLELNTGGQPIASYIRKGFIRYLESSLAHVDLEKVSLWYLKAGKKFRESFIQGCIEMAKNLGEAVVSDIATGMATMALIVKDILVLGLELLLMWKVLVDYKDSFDPIKQMVFEWIDSLIIDITIVQIAGKASSRIDSPHLFSCIAPLLPVGGFNKLYILESERWQRPAW